jgi:hypothetical protein
MATKTPIAQKFDKYISDHSGEWVYKCTGNVGRSIANGSTINTGVAGIIWVRTTNGQEVTAYNRIAPSIWDTHVVLGISKTMPGIWQVIEVREVYTVPASSYVVNHAAQHLLSGTDTVFPDRKQILSLTILVKSGFIVRVFGGLIVTPSGWIAVNNTGTVANPDIDLSSYVPASGALYVSIEANSAGVLSLNVGTVFSAKEFATASDIPIPATGYYPIGFILLSEGQTSLLNTDITVAALAVGLYQPYVYSTNQEIAGRLAVANNVAFWIAPQAGKMASVLIYVDTTGTSGSTTIDVNKNGTTIYTTSGNRPSVAWNDVDKKNETIPDITIFSKGDIFTFDIDAIAAGAKDLNIIPIITA